MNYKVENLEKSMVKMAITISPEKFEEGMEKSFNKNRNKFNIQGFRKGKAPRKMVEKMYGPESLYEDALNFVLPEVYEEAIEDSKLEICSRPQWDVDDIKAGEPVVAYATFAVKPEVTLGEYKGIVSAKKAIRVTEKEIEEELDKVKEQNARMITVEDRAAEDGDTCVIDFTGYVDGEAFEGGAGTNYSLVLGSHSFIDTFEDQLVGKSTGEEVDVNVTFPEDYQAEELKGKPALFKVKINEIQKKELPEVDDEFASEVSEFSTLAEYKDSIKASIKERKTAEQKNQREEEIIGKVVENAKMEIPDPMIDEEVNQMAQDFAQRLQQQGLSFEQYMQLTGMDGQKFFEQMKPQATKRISTRLALEAVVKAENLSASDEEVEKEIENMATMYKMEVEKIKELLDEHQMDGLRLDLAVQKAVDLVINESKTK